MHSMGISLSAADYNPLRTIEAAFQCCWILMEENLIVYFSRPNFFRNKVQILDYPLGRTKPFSHIS
jgi:hypothetical protein